MPRSSTTSRPSRRTRAWWNEFSGQSIRRTAVRERDVRPRHLEVEEDLGVDVREPLGLPGAGEERGRERGALAAVVPAAERRRSGPGCSSSGRRSMRSSSSPIKSSYSAAPDRRDERRPSPPRRSPASVTCRITSPSGRCVRYWISPTIIWATSSPSRMSAPRRWPLPRGSRATRGARGTSARRPRSRGRARRPRARTARRAAPSSLPECGPAAVASTPLTSSSAAGRARRARPARGAPRGTGSPRTFQASSATRTPSARTTIESRKCVPTSHGLSL